MRSPAKRPLLILPALVALLWACAASGFGNRDAAALAAMADLAGDQTGVVCWQSRRTGALRIFACDLDGANLRQVSPNTPGKDHLGPLLSPDGTRIVYFQTNIPLEGVNYYADHVGDLMVVDADDTDGSSAELLVSGVRTYFECRVARWLDDDRIAYIDSNHDGYVYTISQDSSSKLFDYPYDEFGAFPNRQLTHAIDGFNRVFTIHNPGSSGTLTEEQDYDGCEGNMSADGLWAYRVKGGWPGHDFMRMRLGSWEEEMFFECLSDTLPADQNYIYFPQLSLNQQILSMGVSRDRTQHDHWDSDYDIFLVRIDPVTFLQTGTPVKYSFADALDAYPDVWATNAVQQPELHLDPTSRNFTAVEGGANPSSRTIAVTNAAGGTLNNVTTDESAGWLTVSRSGSGNTQTLTNAVDIGGLSAGDYNTTVDVLCANATNSPQTYTIHLTVSEPEPVMTLAPTQLTFGSVSGGANPAPQDVAVGNSGGGTLDDVSVNESAGWLTVQRSGSGNSQTLVNQIDISGLADGNYNTDVQVSAANATNSPRTYTVTLVLSEQLVLASIEVVADSDTILSGGSTDLTATPRDQYGDPISVPMSWSVSGGGSMHPESGSAATEHVSEFRSDGTAGDFTVTASSGPVEGTALLQVAAISLPLRINCGSNSFDVAGWLRDDPFVDGGEDWDNPNTVDVSGVVNAAPQEVYQSVRHSTPHAYTLAVPDGTYLLRLHFADAYTDRSMDYFAEGVQILDDFDIASEAGGVNRALVKDFQVTVADGNGMQIAASGDGDVFECGIEVLEWVVEEPQPDGDGGSQADGDGGEQPSDDGGVQPSDDGGVDPDGGGDASADSTTNVDEDEIVVSGGCGCASSGPSRGFGLSLALFLGLVLISRQRKP